MILKRHIEDPEILWLLKQVISSFRKTDEDIGLPLGNLTSQLLVNVYMHEFDMFIKQKLKVKYYIRYADDFIIISDKVEFLENLLLEIKFFLKDRLKLDLHKDKVFIKTYASGVDFLGWVHFPYHRQIRTTTKRKMIRKLSKHSKPQTISSYRGLLSHGNAYKFQKKLNLL